MDVKGMCEMSFIIPCYMSKKTIGYVIDEICETTKMLGIYEFEIIGVDDCSPDNVYDELVKIGQNRPFVKAIRFAKNFGQHAGMIAGVQNASGEVCVFLDDDGQCPLNHLQELVEPLYEGYDISFALYPRKKQSLLKNLGSKFSGIVANILIDKPKDIEISNFFAFKRHVADEISRYKGPYPYMSGLLFRSSSKVVNVPMEERERIVGSTTYTLRKLVALWLNSFTAFSVKPLRMATLVGGGTATVGAILAVATLLKKLLDPPIQVGWSSLIIVMLVLGGLILFVLGIIGEYVGRIYMSINETPQYVIKEHFNI